MQRRTQKQDMVGLGRRLITDVVRLARLDVTLALVSARDVAVVAGRGTGLMLAGTLVGIVGLMLLLCGIGIALATILPGWLLALVCGIALIAAAIPATWRSWQALAGR